MRTTLCGLALALLLCLPTSARAEEPDLGRMRKQVEQLEQVIAGLLKRIEGLEATIARLKGLPAPTKPTASPDAAPTGDTPRPVPSGPIEEAYDRFTGHRVLHIRSGTLQAAHKGDPNDRIDVHVRWQVEKEPANAPTYDLSLEVRSKIRRWPKDSVVYILIDGERKRTVVDGMIEQRGSYYVEYIVIGFDKEAAAELGAARTVEMRAGEWELEIPASFRRLAARVNTRMDEASGK